MLLYAERDEEVAPDGCYTMGKNEIAVKTPELKVKFEDISAQPDKIAW